MKKNKYIKPAAGVVNVQTYGRMLDDANEYDESANSNWAGYQKDSPSW